MIEAEFVTFFFASFHLQMVMKNISEMSVATDGRRERANTTCWSLPTITKQNLCSFPQYLRNGKRHRNSDRANLDGHRAGS